MDRGAVVRVFFIVCHFRWIWCHCEAFKEFSNLFWSSALKRILDEENVEEKMIKMQLKASNFFTWKIWWIGGCASCKSQHSNLNLLVFVWREIVREMGKPTGFPAFKMKNANCYRWFALAEMHFKATLKIDWNGGRFVCSRSHSCPCSSASVWILSTDQRFDSAPPTIHMPKRTKRVHRPVSYNNGCERTHTHTHIGSETLAQEYANETWFCKLSWMDIISMMN